MKSIKKVIKRDFILLWQGQIVSSIGDQIGLLAIVMWVQEITNSSVKVSLIYIYTFLGSILFSIIGGVFVDIFNRKKLIICLDLIRGIGFLCFAYLLFSQYKNTDFIIYVLYVLILINSSLTSIFNPCIFAIIPDIVEKKSIVTANSMIQTTNRTAGIIALGFSGVFYNLLGIKYLMIFNALSFVLSSIINAFIKYPQSQIKLSQVNVKKKNQAYLSS